MWGETEKKVCRSEETLSDKYFLLLFWREYSCFRPIS